MTEPTYMTAAALHAALTEITDAFAARYPANAWHKPYAVLHMDNIYGAEKAKIEVKLSWPQPRIDGKVEHTVSGDGIMPSIVEMLAWVKSHKGADEIEAERTAQLAECLGLNPDGSVADTPHMAGAKAVAAAMRARVDALTPRDYLT